MADTLLVTAGDVIEVQLTSETVMIETGGRRQEEPGHITNRMRLFVREIDGKEQKYDFDDTELGVRETQRVAIVRGKPRRALSPVNLILYNLSSGEKDTFEPGLRAFLGHKPFFGPLPKAAAFSFGAGAALWLVARFLYDQGVVTSTFFALTAAFLLYPVFWWLCGLWDKATERARYRSARKRFIADMDGRVRAYAPQPAAQMAPAPPPEAQP